MHVGKYDNNTQVNTAKKKINNNLNKKSIEIIVKICREALCKRLSKNESFLFDYTYRPIYLKITVNY